MRINSIISIFKSQVLQRKQTKPSQKTSFNIKDTVKISKTGKALQKNKAEFSIAKKALSNLPDVRKEKIKSVLSNIENNYYNNSAVKEALAKKTLKSGLFDEEISSNKIISKFKSELKKTTSIRENKLTDIRSKLKNNFYNRKDVIADLSERILKELGL